MNRLIGKIVLLVMMIAIIGGIAVESKTHFLKKVINSVVYDIRLHGVNCEELPPLSEVEQIVAEKTRT